MPVPPPLLDKRDSATILAQLQSLAPFYTPEWSAADDEGAGAAILTVFSQLMDGLVQRLNQTPANHFIAFLNSLGAQLLPAQPSRVPLTVFLSNGATGAVTVPARLQAAAPVPGGSPVVFETEKAISATPAALLAVFSVKPGSGGDAILWHLPGLAANAPQTLFDVELSANLQDHAIYFGDDELFHLTSPTQLVLEGEPARRLATIDVAWEWSGADGAWIPLIANIAAGGLLLIKPADGEIQKAEVNGIKTRWIRGRYKKPLAAGNPLADVTLPTVKFSSGTVVPAAIELAFSGDVPVLLPATADAPVLPFGERPRTGNSFFLAIPEALSKPRAEVVLNIEVETPDPPDTGALPLPPTARLSWEYSNGNGWLPLKVTDGTSAFTKAGAVVFLTPDNLAPTQVSGQENHWLRVRIADGDYGQEIFRSGQAPDAGQIKPPTLTKIEALYESAAVTPAFVVTKNNNQFASVSGAVQPFAALDDSAQALYLGFDPAPSQGAISIFFALAEQEYPDDDLPRVEWQYHRDAGDGSGQWSRLTVEDETRGLTEPGVLGFAGPSDFLRLQRFGQSLFWIRAVDLDSRFGNDFKTAIRTGATVRGRALARVPLSARLDRAIRLLDGAKGKGASPCAGDQTALQVRLATALQSDELPEPIVEGIYPNTVWAEQVETIARENLGSATGTPSQAVRFARFPVVTETLQVNEIGSLFESERKALLESRPEAVEEKRDSNGNLVEFWVRWDPVDDLLDVPDTLRAYLIDRTFGTVQFGDGKNGRIPPVGLNNIRATYRTGGGLRGNAGAGTVKTLRTAIPFVDKVANFLAAAGGADTESIDSALDRGSHAIRNRDRAVTADDFEALALAASRAVVRAKAIPTLDDQGQSLTNWVTVILVPGDSAARPFPSRQLRKVVREALSARASNVTVAPEQVVVTGPSYVDVDVTAEVAATDLSAAASLEDACQSMLDSYLHPLDGGPSGTGWEFGRAPCLSDFYGLLEAVTGVDFVSRLEFTLRPVDRTGKPLGASRKFTADGPPPEGLPLYALVSSGRHEITVIVSGGARG